MAYKHGWREPIPDATVLDLFVIYDRPTDSPGAFVVRRWFVVKGRLDSVPGEMKDSSRTLQEARKHVPPGRHRMDRHPDDDPKIIETWW